VTFADITKNEIIVAHCPLLAKASQTVGSLQIRNRATVVGNFVNNAPCADSVPPLLVYDASIKIISAGGERVVPLNEFLLNPYETQLNKNECVVEILIPISTKKYIGDFYKLGRRSAISISRISLAFLLYKEERIIKEFRIASGAITPIGKRFFEIENSFVGREIGSEIFMEIAIKLGEKVLETTGLRWSTTYKLPVVQQMIYQILERNAEGISE
jgi:CO/xanthine dehydrogenase FAD-binding subunit